MHVIRCFDNWIILGLFAISFELGDFDSPITEAVLWIQPPANRLRRALVIVRINQSLFSPICLLGKIMSRSVDAVYTNLRSQSCFIVLVMHFVFFAVVMLAM